MREWLGKLAGVLCVMTILLQLLPEGSFGKYARFYASLLYLLVIAGPLVQLFTREDLLERFLKLELLKEEHYDLESSILGLQDLRNESFRSAYEEELAYQFGEIAGAYGAELEDVRLRFGEDGTLDQVHLKIRASSQEAGGRIRGEIAGIYGLGQQDVYVQEVE